MFSIVVSCRDSFKMLATDMRTHFVLGYETQDVHHRDLAMFYGPLTHSLSLKAMLERARDQRYSSNLENILYDRFGRAHRMLVSTSACDQLLDPTTLADSKHCLLILQYVPAIIRPITSFEIDSVAQETAWVLLSAPWPYDVERLSHRFTLLLGYQDNDLVGQNLHAINPPNHMFSAWRSLLRSAAMGQPARDVLLARSRAGRDVLVDVSCIPVIDPGDGMGSAAASFRGIVAMFEDFNACAISSPASLSAAAPDYQPSEASLSFGPAEGVSSDLPAPQQAAAPMTSWGAGGAPGRSGWAVAGEEYGAWGGVSGDGGLAFAPEPAEAQEEGRRRAARMDQRYLRRVRRQLGAMDRPGRATAKNVGRSVSSGAGNDPADSGSESSTETAPPPPAAGASPPTRRDGSR